MMAMAVMDGLQMVCQSGVTGGNGLSGVGYGGVDEEGTKVPSVKEFNDFCDMKGYSVSNIDMNSLINQYLTHCCVDPVTREDVITDTSYGGLYWTIKGDLSKYGEGEDGLIEYNT
jgi:hypothetical protein